MCVYIYIYMCVCVCMYIYICICIYVCACVCVCVCVHVCLIFIADSYQTGLGTRSFLLWIFYGKRDLLDYVGHRLN